MIQALVVLVVVGFVLYLLLTYIPMPEPFRKIIIAVAVLFLCLWLLSAFGIVSLPALKL